MSAAPRLLIINPFGIGDVLFTTPLVRALRGAFPASYLGYLCNRRTERILAHNPHLDELFVYERDEIVELFRRSWRAGCGCVGRLVRRLRRRRFEVLVDVSLGERYGFLLALLGVRRRIGFNYRGRGGFLTAALPIEGYQDRHIVEHYRQLLAFMGIRLIEPRLELRAAEDDQAWTGHWLKEHGLEGGRPLVGIVPAGGVSWGLSAAFRRWGFEGFAAVGEALAERYGAQVILFGESSDGGVCREVRQRMRHPAIDLSGETSLGQFISLLGRLSLVICNDGGPLHLAVSQGVKTVSIFGPVDPRVYGPYPPDETQHRVIRTQHLRCQPCYHQFKLPPCPYERACLTTVDAEEVLEACAALLENVAVSATRGEDRTPHTE